MSWNDEETPRGRTTGAYSIGAKERRRRPGWLIPLLLLLGLALIGLLLWALLHGRSDSKKTTAAPTGTTTSAASTTPLSAPLTASSLPGDLISFSAGKVVPTHPAASPGRSE